MISFSWNLPKLSLKRLFSTVTSALVICISVLNPSAFADIYRCQDQQGKLVFTDNIHVCKTPSEIAADVASEVETIELQPLNLHSQYGRHISEEYSNYAFRNYEPVHGYQIKIIAEKALVDDYPVILQQAAEKLEQTVLQALNTFSADIRAEFDGVRYFLFNGEQSSTGGRRGGQWYFSRGNNTSVRFNDSIVVRSAREYLSYSATEALQVAVHELSHAYYYYYLKKIYYSVKEAFTHAQDKSLYFNVRRKDGAPIKQAYALTNQGEYFAELSKIIHFVKY